MSLTYHRPKTLPEAVEHARTADIALAGGALTFGGLDVPYESFVDLQDVPELNRVWTDSNVADHTALIDSGVMLSELLKISWLPHTMHRALTRAIPPNILNRTSVGESLQQRHHPLLREWIAVCVALDIWVERLNVPDKLGKQFESIQSLLNSREVNRALISSIHFMVYPKKHIIGLAHVGQTPTSPAIVCAAAGTWFHDDGTIDGVFIAIVGAAEESVVQIKIPEGDAEEDGQGYEKMRFPEGQPLTEANIDRIVASLSEILDAYSDHIASADYRRAMAKVCAKRALMDCAAQLVVT